MMNFIYSLNQNDINIFTECFFRSKELASSQQFHESERKIFQTEQYQIRCLYEGKMELSSPWYLKMPVLKSNIKLAWIHTPLIFFKEFVSSLPLSIKNYLLEMSPLEAIFKCTDLLLDCHVCSTENDCIVHISLATKLFLLIHKVLSSLPILLTGAQAGMEEYRSLHHYITVIKDMNCTLDVLLLCLRIFLVDLNIFHLYFSIILNKNLNYILSTIQKSAVNFWAVFSANGPESFLCVSHYCLLRKRLLKFLTLSKYGVINKFSPEHYDNYVTEVFDLSNEHLGRIPVRREIPGTTISRYFGDEILPHEVFDSNISAILCTKMRVYQIIYMYNLVKITPSYQRDVEYALSILWATIPDPFLGRKNFMQSCGELTPKKEEFLDKVWTWYFQLIFPESKGLKTPRSLKHLSRCIIRQGLALNFLLPSVVHSLSYPSVIKDYLLLDDCKW